MFIEMTKQERGTLKSLPTQQVSGLLLIPSPSLAQAAWKKLLKFKGQVDIVKADGWGGQVEKSVPHSNSRAHLRRPHPGACAARVEREATLVHDPHRPHWGVLELIE